MKLGTLKDLIDNICFNGSFSIEIISLRQIKEPNPASIKLLQDESESLWGVVTGEIDSDGIIMLEQIDKYDWPDWAKNEELHVTVETA